MNTYLVTWQVHIKADTPNEAVRKARDIQLNPNTIATAFEVQNIEVPEVIGVDLDET